MFATSLLGVLLFATSAFAAKEGIDYFGGSGNQGGKFSSPRDFAVNSSGAGPANAGDIYVLDEQLNRIQRFDADGDFISAWGANVVTPSVHELQKLTVTATGGTYKLSFDGDSTTDIAFNAGSFEIASALQALPTMGAPGNFNVTVSGSGPYTISFNTFSSPFRGTDVPQIAVDASLLTGTASTETVTQGAGQYEICTVAANCRAGTDTGAANVSGNAKNGSLHDPSSIAVDEDTGNVYVADHNNRRVNQYSGDGAFIRSFGFGVDTGAAGVGYEICPAASRCTFGLPGSGAGQIGASFASSGIAVSPADGNATAGTLFVADPGNRRVNTYDLDGTNPGSFGSAAQFGEEQPRFIDVDSRGIVYVSDSNNGDEVDRYDSEDANGGGVGFLAPIASPPLLEGFFQPTRGIAVDPDSDGVGPEEDILYVLRDPSSGSSVVQQFGPVNDPGLTPPPAAADDAHGGAAGFDGVIGLDVDDSNGRLFLASEGAVGGLPYGSRVFILGDSTPLMATIDPVVDSDADSAVFTGSVDPNGARSAYHFEYVDNAEFLANGFANADRVPLKDAEVEPGEAPVDIEQETTRRLDPNTTYHVRLVARQMFTGSTTTVGPVTFTTDKAAPQIGGTAATVGTNTATLRGAINPGNEPVSNYHFKWGPTASYGNTTPVDNLPSGSDPVAVLENLTGLTPGTTYHFQLVATNGSGTTTGPDRTFTTFAEEPGLGADRGYEIVSHNPTGSVPVVPTVAEPDVSLDGNHVTFDMPQAIPGSVAPLADHIQCCWVYKSSRGADRWSMTQTRSARNNSLGTETTRDLSRQLIATTVGVDPDDQNNDRDLYQRKHDGSFLWISRDPRIPVGTPQTAPGTVYVGGSYTGSSEGHDNPWTMSDDGSTVVFRSARPLLDVDPGGTSGAEGHLYKWHEDGGLTFISQRPDGTIPFYRFLAGGAGMDRDAVSRDGSRAVWSATRNEEGGGHTLYVQIDGQPTQVAVKATGVPALSEQEPYQVVYHGADDQLTRVFFASSSRLTPDSGASGEFGGSSDLYVYDVAEDKVRNLTPRLDGNNDPSIEPAPADRANLLGVSAISDDGRRVYFVANGKYDVAPNQFGELPEAGERNLYMVEMDGIDDPIEMRFIGTFAPPITDPFQQEKEDFFAWQYSSSHKMADTNPDGSVLSFASAANLTGEPVGGLRQLFVYDAERDTLECASCPTDGSLPLDEVNRQPLDPSGNTYGFTWQHTDGNMRWVSSRGTVFFDTVNQLVATDQNTTDDVYEFRNGEIRMISGGAGNNPSKLDGSSLDGSTVIFTTSEPLAPQDEEPGVPKIYAAREGGGFPDPPELPSCDINAGACEGQGTSAPTLPGAGSAEFTGPGNIDESAQNRCKKLARAAKKLAARAAKLRREARGAGDEKRAESLRKQARKVAKAADKRSAATKRCRKQAARGANTDGRAGR